jgi:hypothetical protein
MRLQAKEFKIAMHAQRTNQQIPPYIPVSADRWEWRTSIVPCPCGSFPRSGMPAAEDLWAFQHPDHRDGCPWHGVIR